MLPSLVVCHDTAGRTTPGSSVSWFADPKSRVSAHFVVEIDGSVTQMVDCDRTAWHAGKSSWGGRSSCNNFAIGIEIVNPGKLTPSGMAWFGEAFEGFEERTTQAHGHGCWLPYTQAQIDAVKAICAALVEAYPIKDIVTHWMVSPGRKVDCNPLFPLQEVRDFALAPNSNAGTDNWPLALGSEGKNVKALQSRLLELGYSMVKWADGDFGKQTRVGVLAWEVENGITLDGKIDRAEFEKLMAPETKEMVVGPMTAKTEADQQKAARTIEAVAATTTVVTGTATAADVALKAAEQPTLWQMTMQGLGHAGEAVSKIQGIGVHIEPRYAAAALIIVGGIVLWRYAYRAKG